MTKLVYIIDDDSSVREALEEWLALAGLEARGWASAEAALQTIDEHFAGVVVSDVKMPGMDGMALLQKMPKNIPVLLITGHGDIAMAVEAMKQGAYDFIEKPFQPTHLVDAIKRACRQRSLLLENERLRKALASQQGLESILIGDSPGIKRLRRHVHELAQLDVDVLIHGETGVGKELVARCLHDFGKRVKHPFVALNVAAIPENLFESELFGHTAGAFTGAQKAQAGKFEYANKGTLFLDEVESMPLHFQVKVLRALQEREVVRLGSHQAVALDVRVVAATKEDLKKAGDEGRFRSDLYYRLMVAELRIPPLRERREDIALLFAHFLKLAAQKHGKEAPELRGDDWIALEGHNWPGNVRELKNLAERYLLRSQFSDESIREVLSGEKLDSSSPSDQSLASRVAEYEKAVISAELTAQKGNINQVMEELDLPRRTLNQKMQRYGLRREDFLGG
ncbi:response regulator [Hahella sp. KA22]|uniref:sigma-54-dependent transcriptional regulator n=1 Tax=Hahella sp. KA22 TaxID=1628392 RepID=UPI000FDE606F|nr:sigma-54 dependent transcriptional regulator [Hahella sp. KA22]AZZ90364.1 sigma-54-dependent Fis family transcriptional regulator [Hahella sp. KA22]QAY53735.1 response regulator [Hahella sp. KA22]